MESVGMGQRYKAVKMLVDYWTQILPRVPSSTVVAIISHESGFNPNALNEEHYGLMQIAPATAVDTIRELKQLRNPAIDISANRYSPMNQRTLMEPDLNVLLGVGYLNILAKAFSNDSDMVIAGYNRGRKGAEDLLHKIGKEGIAQLDYVRHVNAIRKQLESITT